MTLALQTTIPQDRGKLKTVSNKLYEGMCLRAPIKFQCEHHHESAAEDSFEFSTKSSSQEFSSFCAQCFLILWMHRQISLFYDFDPSVSTHLIHGR